MGDVYLRALGADLEQTQRALSRHCIFCVPQPRSLLTDEALTQDVLYSHVLTREDADDERTQLGEYRTLNGKQVTVRGSHIHTEKGFKDRRQVRIVLSEKRRISHQEVTVLHISRPLEGGIEIPDDPSVIDIATFRKYTAILRSFPENALVFFQLDETISQVSKICAQEHVYERYKETLPANLREEWEAAVEDLIRAGSFDDDLEVDRLERRDEEGVSHLLQLQQVVECYLMENLHDLIFPRVVASCHEQDQKLQQVLYQMKHYTPDDFGLRQEFQCFMGKARDTLSTIVEKKTPLDMLLVFKTCIDQISDGITQNIKLRRLDFETYQLTTDDILDQLLVVLVQVFNHVTRNATASASFASSFPFAAVIKYISDYHFINSNTTALGFSMANFQVAVEYFLLRGEHEDDCKDCAEVAIQGKHTGVRCLQAIAASKCEQAAHRIRLDLEHTEETVKRVRRDTGTATTQEIPHSNLASDGVSTKHMSIIGAWSTPTSDWYAEKEKDTVFNASLAVHPVTFINGESRSSVSETNILQVSGGQRFFALVMEDGKLMTWGDSSGGRLGYALAAGELRRVTHPRRVVALEKSTITQVSCGGFHALVTDVNGYVYAWGNNARGQLGINFFSSPVVTRPSLVETLRGVYVNSVACGEYHSLALSSAGSVFSWGCNKYGQLGRTAEKLFDAMEPRLVDTNWTGRSLDLKLRKNSREKSMVSRIAAGKDHSLAISSDRGGFTWGRGDSGQLGHGCYMDASEPMQVMALSAPTCGLLEVAGGKDFSLFLLQNGTVCISGWDPSLDSDNVFLSPRLLTLPSHLEREFFGQIISVSCGETHYALLSKSGALLLSFASYSQPSPNAGSTTTEKKERRVTWVQEAGAVRQMDCGASHTLVVL